MKKAFIVKTEFSGNLVGSVYRLDDESVIDNWKHHRMLRFIEKINVPDELDGEDILTIPLDHLKGVLLDEKWTKAGESDSTTQPVYSVDTWTKAGESSLTSQPTYLLTVWSKEGEVDVTIDPEDVSWTEGTIEANDASWTKHISGSNDISWTFIPATYEVQLGDSYVAYNKEKRIKEAYALMTVEIYTEMKTVYLTDKSESATASYLTWLAMLNSPTGFSTAGLVSKYAVGGLTVGAPLDTDAKVLAYANDLIELSENYAVFREQKIQAYLVTKAAIEVE